jgi:hypothetical protein
MDEQAIDFVSWEASRPKRFKLHGRVFNGTEWEYRTYVIGLFIDAGKLAGQCQRAASNKSRKSCHGVVEVQILVEQRPEAV